MDQGKGKDNIRVIKPDFDNSEKKSKETQNNQKTKKGEQNAGTN